jgi:uncharacterized membrane protein SpoIIM required for sporulation
MRLNDLLTEGNSVLYHRALFSKNILAGFWWRFPATVRHYGRWFWLSAALFFVPLTLAALYTMHDPSYAGRVAPREMLDQLSQVYAEGFKPRSAGENTMMFGFYIWNNIGIALRSFALGVIGGFGTVYIEVFNGLATGAVLGYVAVHGGGSNIITFIMGHSSFELLALVIAGQAGFVMGWSLIARGVFTRLQSLKRVSPDLVVLVVGVMLMLTCAAMTEGYWSASQASAFVKRLVGGTVSLAVISYLSFVGLGHSIEAQNKGFGGPGNERAP